MNRKQRNEFAKVLKCVAKDLEEYAARLEEGEEDWDGDTYYSVVAVNAVHELMKEDGVL